MHANFLSTWNVSRAQSIFPDLALDDNTLDG